MILSTLFKKEKINEIKILFYILFFILLIHTVDAKVTPFRKPDFIKYPNLQIVSPNMTVHDFSETKKITYYYNIIGTEIPFTLNETKLYFKVVDVDYDKQLEEYATIQISDKRGYVRYVYLYQGNLVKVKLFNEEIILLAESIIDHDNIEYLTIVGLKEIEESIEEPISEEEEEEIILEETQLEKISEEEKEINYFVVPGFILLIVLILFLYTLFRSKHNKK